MAAISPITAEQWGMITAGQARRAGVARHDLNRLVDDGTLAVAGPAARVYRLTGAPENPELDPLRATWLQLGGDKWWHERVTAPDVVVAHRSAAHLRGLGDLIPHEHEFYAATRLRPRRTDVKIRVRAEIAPGSWEIHDGLPVHTVPAIVDDLLSDHEDESAVAQVVRDAIDRGVAQSRALMNALDRHTGAYGHSSPEEFLRALIDRAARS